MPRLHPMMSRLLLARRVQEELDVMHEVDRVTKAVSDEAKAKAALYPPVDSSRRATPIEPPVSRG